jgi:hypothetical protein
MTARETGSPPKPYKPKSDVTALWPGLQAQPPASHGGKPHRRCSPRIERQPLLSKTRTIHTPQKKDNHSKNPHTTWPHLAPVVETLLSKPRTFYPHTTWSHLASASDDAQPLARSAAGAEADGADGGRADRKRPGAVAARVGSEVRLEVGRPAVGAGGRGTGRRRGRQPRRRLRKSARGWRPAAHRCQLRSRLPCSGRRKEAQKFAAALRKVPGHQVHHPVRPPRKPGLLDRCAKRGPDPKRLQAQFVDFHDFMRNSSMRIPCEPGLVHADMAFVTEMNGIQLVLF